MRVGRVEHGDAVRRDVLHDHALDHREVFDRADVVQAEVVARADVGDHGHLAAVEAQAFAQDAAARGLEHRRVDVGVDQHVARAARAAAIAGVDALAVHVDAVGVGHAHALARRCQQVGDQARTVVLPLVPVTATTGMRPLVRRAEQVDDDGLADRAALAVRGLQVHAQAGRGVDLDHAAALVFQRREHAFANHVHAADVEADHLRRGHGARGQLGVHVVGDVGGGAAGAEVGVVAQDHALALGRHGVGLEALVRQAASAMSSMRILRERRGMAVAAARVGVDLLDQLAHGVLAVADHLRRIAARRGDQPVADHQQAEVVAGKVFLHHHRADLDGRVVGRIQMLARVDVDRHALALVAVARLDHHRHADLLRGGPGIVGVVHRPADGHRHAGGAAAASW